MGYEDNFDGGMTFDEFNTSLNNYGGLMNLVLICIVVIILIVVLVIVSRKQKEKFRHLYINRAKLANKGGQQSSPCASYNRSNRVTEGAWSQLYDPNAKYEETDEMRYLNSRYINQKVLDEINNSNDKINNADTPFDNNQDNMSEIDKIVDDVKNEIENNTTDINNEIVNPNGSIDPLDTKEAVNNYVLGNEINGNREPFIRNGPVEREEFMTRNNKHAYMPLLGAKNMMHNTEEKQPMDLKIKAYANRYKIKQ